MKKISFLNLAFFAGISLYPAITHSQSLPKPETVQSYQDKEAFFRIENSSRKTYGCDCNYTYSFQTLKEEIQEPCSYKARYEKKEPEKIIFRNIISEKEIQDNASICRRNPQEICPTDADVKSMKYDLFNYVADIEDISVLLKDKRYTEQNPKIPFGQCSIEVDLRNNTMTPPPERKGQVGRLYLYFHKNYNFYLTDNQRKLFEKWDKDYPENFRESNNIFKIENKQKSPGSYKKRLY